MLELTAKEQYGEYLKSDDWENKKLEAIWRIAKRGHKRHIALRYFEKLRLEVEGNRAKCQSCFRRGKVQFHHIRYRRTWEQTKPRRGDLLMICSDCHQLIHSRSELTKNTFRKTLSGLRQAAYAVKHTWLR